MTSVKLDIAGFPQKCEFLSISLLLRIEKFLIDKPISNPMSGDPSGHCGKHIQDLATSIVDFQIDSHLKSVTNVHKMYSKTERWRCLYVTEVYKHFGRLNPLFP